MFLLVFYFRFTFVTLAFNCIPMKIPSLVCVAAFCVVFSCQKDNQELRIERQKDAQRKEQVFQKINQAWHFTIPSLAPHTNNLRVHGTICMCLLMNSIKNPKVPLEHFKKRRVYFLKNQWFWPIRFP